MANRIVSIIVPVYNVESYLNKCIESLINQTYKNVEIILVNDGSKDNSGKICDQYAKEDSRIIVIHKENGGVSSARNVGLKASSGYYIMFVDSDDWLEKDAVSSLMSIQNSDSYDVIMFGVYREDFMLGKTINSNFKAKNFNDKYELRSILPKLIKEELINSLWNKMYKSNIIKENNIVFDESISIAEDALFNYKVFLEIESFYIVDKCFYHYAIRNTESLTKRYNYYKYDMLIYVNDYLQDELKKNTYFNNALPAAQHIRVKNIYSCFLDMFADYCPLSVKEKRAYISEIIKKEDNKYYYHSNDKSYKILVFVLSTRNVSFIYFITYIISKIRK